MPSLQEAVQYISYYRAQGYSDEQIRMGLIQQGYTEDILNEAFTPSTHDHHKHTGIFVILTIIVLCAGAGLFFFWMHFANVDSSIDTRTTTTTGLRLTTTTLQDYTIQANEIAQAYSQDEQLQLSSRYRMQLCYDVNEEKEPYCFLNPYGDFAAGETVYVYFRPLINSVEKEGKKHIAFVQQRRVYDPLGRIIQEYTATPITYEREVPVEGTYSIGSFNSIQTTKEMSLGEYYIEIIIEHTYTSKRERLIIPFYLT